ncbi:MAG: 1-acyl-sn-glycerol-3-phosphate acyltransferase [Campylobacteraceae bacterium]|jgi:1-acyl-sn-glycerol-3-phosphate acyltransferase|nr:1-acyl-sn-glycerol-3-phosphate acyltransferase [Campylobacteraceae bacterium]
MFDKFCTILLINFAKFLTGVRLIWRDCEPVAKQRIYYANHSSHADFVLIWSALPKHIRENTRAIAAADYWSKTAIRKFMIHKMFNAVLVDRSAKTLNPLKPILEALRDGYSIIIFPEGTRNKEDVLLPFKSGIYLLAKENPEIEIVPIWLDNFKRVMPKGHFIPLPLLCTLVAGSAVKLKEGETKQEFLNRLRDKLIASGEELPKNS